LSRLALLGSYQAETRKWKLEFGNRFQVRRQFHNSNF